MIRLSLLISVLLIGLSMALAKNQWQFRHLQKQLSRNNQQSRIVRNLMGKLIDTDTNTIYTVDGQKQEDKPSNSDATTSPTTVPSAAVPKLVHALPNLEETACIAACHACIEDYTLETVSLEFQSSLTLRILFSFSPLAQEKSSR
jgi:hypothetical protein